MILLLQYVWGSIAVLAPLASCKLPLCLFLQLMQPLVLASLKQRLICIFTHLFNV